MLARCQWADFPAVARPVHSAAQTFARALRLADWNAVPAPLPERYSIEQDRRSARQRPPPARVASSINLLLSGSAGYCSASVSRSFCPSRFPHKSASPASCGNQRGSRHCPRNYDRSTARPPIRGICVAGFNDVSHFYAISVLRGNRGIHTAVKFRHTILVVDDDPTFRDLYSTALRFRGFNVVTASDGLNALRAVEQDVPSLIILDLNMPCVDGSSVLRELAAHDETRAVPVIVVTGADTDRAALQASAILRKPVLPEHVLPFIERELHEQSAGRQMSCEREVNQKSR